tara:strand:- start:635 stop:1603 length:969 start_codon:yes stop_codon:yes gene_type:complete
MSSTSLAVAADALLPRLLSREHLLDGCDGTGQLSEHAKRKIFFCNCIQVLCERLKLRQRVAATAMCWFRRFYARQTFEAHDPILMAPTCVWCASKMGDCRPVHFTRIVQQLEWLELHFPYSNGDMVEAEREMQEELGGRFDACNPHRPFSLYLAMAAKMGAEVPETVIHLGWSLLNDSFRTDVVLVYPQHVVALACVRLACELAHHEIPPLHAYLHEEPVGQVVDELLHLYEGCRQIKAASFPALACAWPCKRQAQGRAALLPAKHARANSTPGDSVPGSAHKYGYSVPGSADQIYQSDQLSWSASPSRRGSVSRTGRSKRA